MSCSTDSDLTNPDDSDSGDDNNTPSTEVSQITFKSKLTSRLSSDGFESGDVVKVYFEDAWCAYSYGDDDIFSSSSPIEVSQGSEQSYIAVYPSYATGGSFYVSDNQSTEEGYYGSDLLAAYVTDDTEQPTLDFEHVMSGVLLTLEFVDEYGNAYSDVEYSDLKFSAIAGSAYSIAPELKLALEGSLETLTPYYLGDDCYSIMIPAQSFDAPIATITVAGESFEWEIDRDLSWGTQYSYTWTFTLGLDQVLGNRVNFNSSITSWEDVDLVSSVVDVDSYALTKSNFAALDLDGDVPNLMTGSGYGNIGFAFDSSNTLIALNTSSSVNGYHTDGGTGYAASFDLGAEYVITDFKYWQRRWSHIYDHGNLKTWRLWGATSDATDTDGSIKAEYQVVDVNGLPDFTSMNSDDTRWILLTQETQQEEPGDDVAQTYDYEEYGLVSNGTNWVTSCGYTTSAVVGDEYTLSQVAALAGHSYSVSDRTAVRYLRLELLNSWNSGSSYVISEIDIYGVTLQEYEAAVEAANND